ncbi:hypothetical protein [Spirochaeta africana]|uniref:Uncharacterized protein n=1 Tax=Spirochaeta africana (strain ATCC 700263 / DSM 8902 / Z-7692) TaxID=889378 RepID=H9UMA5_SPIAZ|nr:hypothetical protein [Spirochaeta africana]AFG38648.1 hypothetical protein Spiaf_2622 [Spirochaeta africana DSM 8902]
MISTGAGNRHGWGALIVSAGISIALMAAVPGTALAQTGAGSHAGRTFTGQRPAALPGSVAVPGAVEPGGSAGRPSTVGAASSGPARIYLSQQEYEAAVAHFQQLLGEPITSTHDSRSGSRTVFFAYRAEQTQPGVTRYTGVRITTINPDNAVPAILRELRSAVQRGFLTQARYDEIAREHADLVPLFFRPTGAPAEHGRAADAAVLRRYRNFVQTGLWMESAEMQQEMMRLAAAGDQAGLIQLQQQLEQNVSRVQQLQTTAAIVDHWLDSLAEIRALAPEHGFRLQIDMEYTATYSDDMKG